MKLYIKKIDEAASLPKYAMPGDAGMDLAACESAVIPAGKRATIRTGIAMAIPEGYVGLVWDRSGHARKSGITCLAGVIDSGYRGEIGVVLYNTSENDFQISVGDRIAQLLIQPVVQPELEFVDNLDTTERGDAGWGKSGV